jgi:hypothetical protein
VKADWRRQRGGEEAQGRVEAEYVLAASGQLLITREVHFAMVEARNPHGRSARIAFYPGSQVGAGDAEVDVHGMCARLI